MRTLASLLAAAAIAAIGFADPASADKPTTKPNHGHFTSGFSAPFVAVVDNDDANSGAGVDAGDEVTNSDGQGSKGDVDNDGAWAVITGDLAGTPPVSFDICMDADSITEFLLATVAVTTGTADDLDILADGTNVPTASYRAPLLRIRVSDGSCGGQLLQESGTDVTND